MAGDGWFVDGAGGGLFVDWGVDGAGADGGGGWSVARDVDVAVVDGAVGRWFVNVAGGSWFVDWGVDGAGVDAGGGGRRRGRWWLVVVGCDVAGRQPGC